MSKVIDLPSDLTDSLKIADLLELTCLINEDNNVSKSDLEQELRRSSVFDSPDNIQDEEIEKYCLKIFQELEFRAKAAGKAYPFLIKSSLMCRIDNYSPLFCGYIFSLCLSYFGWKNTNTKKGKINPRLLFEELSGFAASAFIQGKIFLFGTSRLENNKKNIKSFKQAVEALCKALDEGDGFREQDDLNKKDDKVDIVCYRDFQDERRGKLVLFGQCASGNNWRDKLSELMPDEFFAQWMKSGKISPLIKSFFTPHCIETKEWDYSARRGGILFDRLRISYWIAKNPEFLSISSKFETWINTQF